MLWVKSDLISMNKMGRWSFPIHILITLWAVFIYLHISPAFFILISFTDKTALFCSSRNLIEALDKPTAFCSFIGSVYYYTIIHLSILWLCHAFILFWKIKFPFHARQYEKKKIIHVLVVLLAVVLPTIPVIVSFSTGGFVIGSHPPSFCVSKSSDAAYYTLALPMSIMGATGVSLNIYGPGDSYQAQLQQKNFYNQIPSWNCREKATNYLLLFHSSCIHGLCSICIKC